jgi:ribosomal protein S18 acetylase RimI-like enzyme
MIKVRKADIKEIDDIQELYKDLKSMEESKFGQACSIYWSFKQQDQKYFGNRITEDSGIVLVAEDEEGLKGFICGFVADQADIDGHNYAKIENIYVDPAMRGEGVGGMLLDGFTKAAGEKDSDVIKVSPIIQNELAANFYRHKGFRDYAVVLQKDID